MIVGQLIFGTLGDALGRKRVYGKECLFATSTPFLLRSCYGKFSLTRVSLYGWRFSEGGLGSVLEEVSNMLKFLTGYENVADLTKYQQTIQWLLHLLLSTKS